MIKICTSLTILILFIIFWSFSGYAGVTVIDLPDDQPQNPVFNQTGAKVLISCTGDNYNLIYYSLSGSSEYINTDTVSGTNKATPYNVLPINNLNMFAVANCLINSVSFVDMTSGSILATLDTGIEPIYMADCTLDTSERILAVVNSYSNELSYINLQTLSLIENVSLGSADAYTILWADSQDKLYINCPESETIIVQHLYFDQGVLMHDETVIPVGAWPNAIALNNAETELIIGSSETGTIQYLDTSTDLLLPKVHTVPKFISEVIPLLSADRLLISHYNDEVAFESSRITLLNTTTGVIEDSETTLDCQILNHAISSTGNVIGFNSWRTDEIIMYYVDLVNNQVSEFGREVVAPLPSGIAAHPVNNEFYLTSVMWGDLSVVDFIPPIINNPPVCCFTMNPAVYVGPGPDVTIAFDASCSFDPDPGAGDSINSYSWDFGDGTGATGMASLHTYTSSGDYTVVLTIVDSNGAESSCTDVIHIEFT